MCVEFRVLAVFFFVVVFVLRSFFFCVWEVVLLWLDVAPLG